MEKTKAIPGWYQRLSSHHSRSAAQVSFKQYCQENETRMKILYPFLPLEQLRGKLLARWKKKQPRERDNLARSGVKKQKKSLKPACVHFLPRNDAATRVFSKDCAESVDWLKRTRVFKFAEGDGKTYRGRAFVLPPKVPGVICEAPGVEKGILKNGGDRGGTTGLGEKRQPASQVSFTLADHNQGNQSPSLYSPPTPFVLSPASDLDRTEGIRSDEEIPCLFQRVNNEKVRPHLDPIGLDKNVKWLSGRKPYHPSADERQGPELTRGPAISFYDRSNTIQAEIPETQGLPKRPFPSKRCKRSASTCKPETGNKIRQVRKSPRRVKEKSSCQPEHTLPSQFLEPPKFGPTVSVTPKKKPKRFSLFEDEYVPPDKKRPAAHRSKPFTKTASKKTNKHFSWSPALECSQQTPRVKKGKRSIFSQERPETYHKPRRNVPKRGDEQHQTDRESSKVRTKKSSKQTHDDPRDGSLKADQTARQPEALRRSESGIRRKSPRTADFSDGKTNSTNVQKNLYASNACAFPKTFRSLADTELKPERIQPSKAKRPAGRLEESVRPRTGTERGSCKLACASSSSLASNPEQEIDLSRVVTKPRHPSENDERNDLCKRRQSIAKYPERQVDLQNSRFRFTTRELQSFEENSAEDTRMAKSLDNITLSSNRISRGSYAVPDPASEKEGDASSPQEDTGFLTRLILQLKSTAESSNFVPWSSPAQSRITEISEPSPKISSGAPSPSSEADLLGDLCRSEIFGRPGEDRTLTKVSKASRSTYRRRGNVLCNLFDDSCSPPRADAPCKARRYLPSDAGHEESDFSMQFSADVFI